MDKNRYQVLLAEDGTGDAASLQKAFGQYKLSSFKVFSSSNLKETLQLLQNEKIDAVLLDIGLPDGQGLDSLQYIQHLTESVPLIILTDKYNENEALQAIRAGAYDYLEKNQAHSESIARAVYHAIECRQNNLHDINDRYRKVFDNILEGVQIIDFDWRYAYLNEAIEKQSRRPNRELLGKEFTGEWEGVEKTELFTVMKRCMEERVACQMENEFVYPDGSSNWFELSIQPTSQGIFILSIDINERKNAEKNRQLMEAALKEKIALQERIEKIAATAPGIICSYRLHPGGSVGMPYASRAIRDILGLLPEDVAEDIDAFSSRIHKDDIEKVLNTIRESARTMSLWQAEYRYRHPQKGEIWLEERSMPLLEEDGSIVWHGFITDISKRKEMELVLRESENRLISILRTTSDGFLLLNAAGDIVDINEASCQMTGYSRIELLKMNITHLDAAGNSKAIQQHLKDVLKKGAHLFETRYRHKNGRIYDIEVSASVLSDEKKQLAAFCRDITRRKQTELENRQNTEDLELINQLNEAVNRGCSMEEMVKILDKECRSSFAANGASFFLYDEHEQKLNLPGFCFPENIMAFFERIIGGKAPPIRIHLCSGSLPWRYLHAESGTLTSDADEIKAWMAEFFESEDFPAFMKDRLKKNFDKIYRFLNMRSLITVPLVQNKKIIGLLGITSSRKFDDKDLTRFRHISRYLTVSILRKQNEEALCTANERFSQMAGNIQEGFWLYNQKTKRIEYVSPAYQTIWDCHADAFYRDAYKFFESIHPEDRHILLNAIEKQSGGHKSDVEYRIVHHDGGERWIWDRSFPVFDEKGKLEKTAGIVTDITDYKNSQMKLKESESFLMSVIQSTPSIIVVYDLDGYFLYSNNRWENQSDEQFHSTNIRDVVHPDYRQGAMQAFQKSIETKSMQRSEHLSITQTGGYRWYEVNYNPVIIDGEVKRVTAFVSDIQERRQARIDLEASEEKYRQLAQELEQRVRERTAEVQDLYDNAPAGYHSLDENGVIVMINQTELNWLGYAKGEVVGKMNFLDIITPAYHEYYLKTYPNFKKQGFISDMEFEFIRKDGSTFPVLLNATAINDEHGNFVMSRSTITDITQRKLAEKTLRQSRDSLQAANIALEQAARMKDEFMASMSHELRTPLTGILGLSEVLLLRAYGEINEKQEKAIRNIESSGRHLLDLINDVLDLSKIEAGKLELNFEPCSMDEICKLSIQMINNMAEKKNQKIEYSSHLVSATIWVDERRLKQMLVNLLSNAVKFTPQNGSLGLDVSGSEEENVVIFTVWDNGIGIEAEKIPLLFKPFVQLDSGLARQHAGSGLGLSLVQKMAELHGGSLHVASTPGEGSRFSIHLPWQKEVKKPEVQLMSRLDNLRQSLTVEDNEVDAEHITRYLSNLGIDNIVLAAADGAVETAVKFKPDVIMLDLLLPDKPGLEVLVDLKADERTRSIPVIITSVVDQQNEAFELGAAGYLLKPFIFSDIHAELSKVLSVSHAPGLVLLIAPRHDIPVILIVDDNEITRQAISDYLKTQKMHPVTASSGEEMLNIVSEIHPDIILMDIQMPGMDGLEATRKIRCHPDPLVASVPIISITALAMRGDSERCLQAGANEYLAKPFQMIKLLELVKKHLPSNTDQVKSSDLC